jgi:hypothetical protein
MLQRCICIDLGRLHPKKEAPREEKREKEEKENLDP